MMNLTSRGWARWVGWPSGAFFRASTSQPWLHTTSLVGAYEERVIPSMTMRDSALAGAVILLLHGGLWEEGMDATRFWLKPGITAGLERAGWAVLAPNRLQRPSSWEAEIEHLSRALPSRPIPVVAGSNGCSVAVRLALAGPDRIEKLLLAWPATANDPVVDTRTRRDLADQGASDQIISTLLEGQTHCAASQTRNSRHSRCL